MLAPDLGPSLTAHEIVQMLWPDRVVVMRRTPKLASGGKAYALLPSTSSPTLLLPTAPRKVVAAALKGYKSPSTRLSRIQMRATAIVGRFGGGRLVPGTIVIEPPRPRPGLSHPAGVAGHDSFVALLSAQLREDLHAGIHLGPARANRKPVLQLMKATGETVGFAKMGINALTDQRVRHEGEALERLADADLGVLQVPRLISHATWRSRPYVAMRPVSTWSRARTEAAQVGAAMTSLVAAFPERTSPLSDLGWWTDVRDGLAALVATDSSDKAPARVLADRAATMQAAFGARPLRAGAAHGDWTPWNMATNGDRVAVWDWERFDLQTPVGWDGLHYTFQREVNSGRGGAPEALRRTWAEAGEAVTMNGAPSGDADLLFALYLLRLGYRFVIDGQLRAGSRRGPLQTWLVPALDHAVTSAVQR